MHYKKLKCALSTVIAFLLLLSSVFISSAAIATFETQYDYDNLNKSWLTDLTLKESLNGISDMVTNVTLVANPDYPYVETPESFKNDVKDACKLYTLNDDAPRAAYIYIFEVMNQNSAILEDDTSDEEIRQYLINAGIVYPDNTDADTLVMARALYVVMKSGSLDVYLSNGSIPAGTALESAVVSFMSVLTGVDMNAVREWTDVDDNLSLDEYILAMSKYALWCSGYDVSVDMPEAEVYRLIALMTIRKQGITAPDNIDSDEIKIRYLAAMLGTKYDVSVDAEELQRALNDDNVAFYILQLMGRDSQLTLQADSITYENAFKEVAENTSRFDMELGEFYADVYKYTATLKYRRSSVWLYPTSYVCNNKNNAAMMTITANGELIADGNFSEIKLDPSLAEQTICIKTTYDYNAEKYTSTYFLTIVQGLLNPDSVLIETPDVDDFLSGDYEVDDSLLADTFIPNDTDFVGGLLGSIGLGVGFGDLLDSFTSSSVGSSTVSGSINNMMPSVNSNANLSFSNMLNSGYLTILPSVGTVGNSATGLKDTSIKMSVSSMEQFSSAPHAEKSNVVLSGIGGLELYSVADSVAGVLGGAGTAIGDTVSPMIGTVVHDVVFDDGESVVGPSVNDTVATSNIDYLSALTDDAVVAYSNGDVNAAAGVDVKQFLSHQNLAVQNNNLQSVDIQNSDNEKNTSYYVLIAAASLAVLAGIVIIVVSKQKKVSYN